MHRTTRRLRHLLLGGLVTTVLTTGFVASTVHAEPQPVVHQDHLAASEISALPLPERPLPGGDSTLPGAAAVLILTAAGLAWVARRSAPSETKAA